jgi:hypothetical protein
VFEEKLNWTCISKQNQPERIGEISDFSKEFNGLVLKQPGK